MHGMAVLFRLSVKLATQEQLNELDVHVGQAMMQAGGPPAGLMSHVVYPEGEDFVLAEVWRAPDEAQTYFDTVLRPLMSEVGLTGDETTVSQVWSFARP
jgi:hypothetical protein